ncbi:MAG: methyltransferase domain-containing protein [Candidatus Limnocylindria bacterium]
MTTFRLPLSLRADAVELLDSGQLTPREIERNLADLARLNRLPGGTRASAAGIRRLLAGRRSARVLDVGTGRGDVPIAFARRGWDTTAVDTHPEVVKIARSQMDGEPGIQVMQADAGALPFEDGTFDVSHCSLLVHHLDPDAVVSMLREMRRVARLGVVINDLRRGLLPLVSTAASVIAIGGSRVTRTDGLTSARRAYTLDELDRMVDDAGLAVRWRSPRWMPRVVTATTPVPAR